MRKTLSNFNYYRSYRLKILPQDDVKVEVYLINHEQDHEQYGACLPGHYELLDINIHYLTLRSTTKLKSSDKISLKLSRKRFFNQWDVFVEAQVMHSYCDKDSQIYAISIQQNIELQYFLKEFINRFSKPRLQKQLIQSSMTHKNQVDEIRRQGIETYSLIHQFSRLFYKFSRKLEIQQVLRETARLVSCEDINIWLIDPEKNLLVNKHTTYGSSHDCVDIRHAHLGRVFSTQTPLNIKYAHGQLKLSNQEIKNFMAAPLFNQNHVCIGVIEFLNQHTYDRFSCEHENIMFLCSQIISSLYESFHPRSKNCEVDSFNDSPHTIKAYLGHSNDAQSSNKMISEFKFTDQHVHILGEPGTGKTFLAHHITDTGRYRRLEKNIIDIKKDDIFELIGLNWNSPGTVIIENIDGLKKYHQIDLYERIKSGQRRVITTSSTDLQTLFKNKEFNSRLYHQVSEGLIHLPPLRSRQNDIIDIANELVKKEAFIRGLDDVRLSPDSLIFLTDYHWPENLKELSSLIKKSLMRSSEKMITLEEKHHKKSLGKSTNINEKDEFDQLVHQLVEQSDKTLSAKQLEKSLEKAITAHKSDYNKNAA